jgi:multidrug efflux system outer membrane protein
VKQAVVAALLAGCINLAPKYERPPAPVPAQLPGGEGNASAAAMPLAQFVRDARLQQVLGRVLAQNRSLHRAAADIESARALYGVQRAQYFPMIDGSVNFLKSRQYFGIPGAPTVDVTTYGASVGMASWEIDLFGRIRNLTEVKRQAYYAAIESLHAEQISLIAETSTAYITYAADRSRLAIAQQTMTTSKKAMDLTEQLVGGGTSNRGDYWQAATVYQQARSDVAELTSSIAQDKNALELLAGGPIGDALLPDALPQQLDWFADVPVGLSSTVLLERPDVLAAEHDLIGANANIGAARAQFFPKLSLTASAGLISAAFTSLLTGPTAIFTVAPVLGVPLFHGGANFANLQYTKAQKVAMIASYELAIQSAFREVADALARRATIDEQLAAQTALVDANQKSLDLAVARYKAGIDPFLATLVSARALYLAQNTLVLTQLAALVNRVTLYRVLGGGLH